MNGENKDLPAEWDLPAGENAQPEGEMEKDLYSPSDRQRSLIFKLMALFVVFAFSALLLGNFLEIFTLPALDFLVESQALGRDPLVQELKQAVVRITASPGGEASPACRQQRGTGFNISAAGLIVTNRHLVEDAGSLNVSFPGRERCQVVDWSLHPDADLALITLADGEFPFVDLEREALPAVGDQVVIIGNPLNYYRVSVSGKVTAYWQPEGCPAPVLEIDAPVYRGSSGSPVFNEEGRVVAIIYAAVERQGDEGTRGLALPVALLEGAFVSPGS